MKPSITQYGAGRPVLLLHGGGGPQTVSDFGERLATELPARVVVPTHPGFGGTPRPDDLTTISGLARVYAEMLEELDLDDVTVVGNSIGGWIAAELALLGSPRVGSVVLVDPVGIVVPDHPVVDFFALTFPEIAELSYYNPDGFRIDPAALPPAAQEQLAANRATLAVYAGEPSMVDPTLRDRLEGIAVPTLVIWGDSDRIADPAYGQAYADAIPGAAFEVLPRTGHLPQLESPDLLLAAVRSFSSTAGSR
ncbi:MAG TPA: alpha/beta hydrolase [Kribbella sp.]|nr:alpha/beta hydrolase [Kribbella sp.]